MASLRFQNVKYEKANAMRSSQRKLKLRNTFYLFILCSALLLFWRSPWFSINVQAFWHVYGLITNPNNRFYAFLLTHAIVLLLYALSGNDNYDQFPNRSESQIKITTPERQMESTLISSDKLVLHKHKSEVGESSTVFKETVPAVTETTTCCTTVTTNEVNVSEKKCYRRVQSESYEPLKVVAPRRELKRFNTGLHEQLHRRTCYVEHLDDEEFNEAMEDEIAMIKRMLWEEQMGEYLALRR